MEGRARPRGRRRARRRARGAAHRRHPRHARHARAAAEVWRRIGLPGSPADQRLPAAATWGGYPGGLAVEKGAPLFPGIKRADRRALDRQPLPPPRTRRATEAGRRRGRRPGSSGWSRSAPTLRTLVAAIEVARAHDGVWATAGVHPHDATEGVDGLVELLDRARGGRGGGVRPRLPLRPLAPDDAARGVRRADRPGPRARSAARDPHPGGVGRHVRHPRRRGRARRARSSTASPAGRTRPSAPSTSARRCRSAASSRSRAPTTCARRRPLCPLDRLLVETDSPYLAPVPHRGQPNRPALVPLVGAAVAGQGATGRRGGRGDLGQRRALLPPGLTAAVDVVHQVFRVAEARAFVTTCLTFVTDGLRKLRSRYSGPRFRGAFGRLRSRGFRIHARPPTSTHETTASNDGHRPIPRRCIANDARCSSRSSRRSSCPRS